MKKYVVGYDDFCCFVCSSRADAEELVLSLTEGNLYRNWLNDNCHPQYSRTHNYETPAEYVATNSINKPYMLFTTNEAWNLYMYGEGYWIDEVLEV